MKIQEFELLPEPKKQAAYLDFLRYENEALKKDILTLKAKIAELEAAIGQSSPAPSGD